MKRSHLVCLIVSNSSEFFTSVLSPCFLFLGFNFLSLNLGARLLATVSDRVNELKRKKKKKRSRNKFYGRIDRKELHCLIELMMTKKSAKKL